MASGSKSTFCRTYWAHDSMSRAGTRVSSPAHRPTIASTPSAPITTRARQTSSPRRPRTRTRRPWDRARATPHRARGPRASLPRPPPSRRARRPRPAHRCRASGRHHRERADGARRDALAAAGTGLLVDQQFVEREMDRLGRTEGQTETAAVADQQIDARDVGGAGMRHGANLSERDEERQASALLGVSVLSRLRRSLPRPAHSFIKTTRAATLAELENRFLERRQRDRGRSRHRQHPDLREREGIVLNEPPVGAIEKAT